jgi:hypothetical protein
MRKSSKTFSEDDRSFCYPAKGEETISSKTSSYHSLQFVVKYCSNALHATRQIRSNWCYNAQTLVRCLLFSTCRTRCTVDYLLLDETRKVVIVFLFLRFLPIKTAVESYDCELEEAHPFSSEYCAGRAVQTYTMSSSPTHKKHTESKNDDIPLMI